MKKHFLMKNHESFLWIQFLGDNLRSEEYVPGIHEELVPLAVQLAAHHLVQVLLHHPKH